MSDDKVLAVVTANPGIGYRRLAEELGVAKSTAENYVKGLGDRVARKPSGAKGAIELTVTARPPSTTQRADLGGPCAVPQDGDAGDHPTTHPPYIDKAVGWAVTAPVEGDELPVEEDYPASAYEPD